MYNDLSNKLFRKYFSEEEREAIRVEARNLMSDITYFEEHMNRLKKSNFNFKVNFHENFNEKSLEKLVKDYSCLTLTSDSLHEVLLRYNLTKFFINNVYDNQLTYEIEKDLADFSNEWSSLYKDEGIAQFVSDFIGCSHGIRSTKDKIISIIKNHNTDEKRED